MDKLIIKDNETGNWMEIYHSENEIIIDTENDKANFQEIIRRFEMLNKINPNMNIEIIHKGENPIWLTRVNGLILSDLNGKIEEIKIN